MRATWKRHCGALALVAVAKFGNRAVRGPAAVPAPARIAFSAAATNPIAGRARAHPSFPKHHSALRGGAEPNLAIFLLRPRAQRYRRRRRWRAGDAARSALRRLDTAAHPRVTEATCRRRGRHRRARAYEAASSRSPCLRVQRAWIRRRAQTFARDRTRGIDRGWPGLALCRSAARVVTAVASVTLATSAAFRAAAVAARECTSGAFSPRSRGLTCAGRALRPWSWHPRSFSC